jgi:hypothetical protein
MSKNHAEATNDVNGNLCKDIEDFCLFLFDGLTEPWSDKEVVVLCGIGAVVVR